MDLIAISSRRIGAQEVKTVNARDLHAFLGVKKDFTDWIKDQILRARLVENRDYVVFPQQGESGGKPRSEYHLTIDAGKHIAMMSQTENGFEVRDYFIECERRAVAAAQAQPAPAPAELSRMDILRLAMESEEGRLKAEAALALAAPKVEFVDRYVTADTGAKGFRQVCKLLKANEARFREFLAEEKIMYRLSSELVAYQNHIDAGRFECKTGQANGHAFSRCLFTPKGVEWVAGEWAKRQVRDADLFA